MRTCTQVLVRASTGARKYWFTQMLAHANGSARKWRHAQAVAHASARKHWESFLYIMAHILL